MFPEFVLIARINCIISTYVRLLKSGLLNKGETCMMNGEGKMSKQRIKEHIKGAGLCAVSILDIC